MNNSSIIYLDNNATTPLDPRVLEAMIPYFTESYANPSSSHNFGQKVNRSIQEAKELIAQNIGATSNEIIFTSGATEAINLAIKGVMDAYSGKGNHIITVCTEHKAVLDTCKFLETRGIDVTYLPVNREGLIDFDELKSSIREETILICVMYVNNETGVIQDIEKICKIAHEKGVLFMTDGTQAVGKMPINVELLDVDLMAFSAHKFYGPKGIGVLYGKKSVKIIPQQHGGGHEMGLRSGTLNMPSIIGLAEALNICTKEYQKNSDSIKQLNEYLEVELLKLPQATINGSKTQRLYNTINVCIPQIEANIFIGINKNIAIANGAACASAVFEASHVLKYMGLSDAAAFSSFRISIGKYNTKKQVDELLLAFKCYL